MSTSEFYGKIQSLRNQEPEKERSERKLTLDVFLEIYNEGLPEQFAPASVPLLRKFQETNPKLFKDGDVWTLDKHRKQYMDWVRQYARAQQLAKSQEHAR